MLKLVNKPISLGIVPVKLFPDKSKTPKFVKFPNTKGCNVPPILLLEIRSAFNLDNEENSIGIVVVVEFISNCAPSISNHRKFVTRPSSVGIVPVHGMPLMSLLVLHISGGDEGWRW